MTTSKSIPNTKLNFEIVRQNDNNYWKFTSKSLINDHLNFLIFLKNLERGIHVFRGRHVRSDKSFVEPDGQTDLLVLLQQKCFLTTFWQGFLVTRIELGAWVKAPRRILGVGLGNARATWKWQQIKLPRWVPCARCAHGGEANQWAPSQLRPCALSLREWCTEYRHKALKTFINF